MNSEATAKDVCFDASLQAFDDLGRIRIEDSAWELLVTLFYLKHVTFDQKLTEVACEYLMVARERVAFHFLVSVIIQKVWGSEAMTDAKHRQAKFAVESWIDINKNSKVVSSSEAIAAGLLMYSKRGSNDGICLTSRINEFDERMEG